MQLLADNGAYALAEQGARLLFFRRRGLVPSWALFVTSLLTFILGAPGVAFAFAPEVPAGVSLGLLTAAALAGVTTALLVRRRRRALARPLDPRAAILVLDREAGQLVEADGRPLAPLEHVRLSRAMQLTSSARMLRAQWPGGSRVVYRGDFLTGSIDPPIRALASRGLRCA